MKFGLITYKNVPYGREKARKEDLGLFNVGDNIQMIAAKRIYTEEMNVREEDIIEIDFHDLGTYKGEYVVVLINLFFFGCHDMKETWFPTSPYIIPVFTGVHFSTSFLSAEEVSYMKAYAPIGCRDEFTLNTMRKYGIEAYLFGCITATLKKREHRDGRNTIFLVDVNETEVLKRMPERYKNCRIETVSHVVSGAFSEDAYRNADEYAKELLKKYSDEAVLVITSRLHCASPCAAMGIPTIMIVREKSQRFSWLTNLIPIYSEEEYDSINWEVNTSDYEEIKGRMITFVKQRFADTIQRTEDISTVSSFFEKSPDDYKRPFHLFYKNLEEIIKERAWKYYLWGGTVLAEDAYHYINQSNQSCEFVGLIDEYNDIEFEGKRSVKFKDTMESKCDVLIVVTPTSSAEYIKKTLIESDVMGKAIFADGSIAYLGKTQ